ncbi:hypothetical protein H7X65_03275 [Candidatus Parcubacteria bacterium]|nr:hypothetical protein [Candidatus Parcubacteria bacterium]
MSTNTAEAPSSETKTKPGVSYPLESTIFALLTGIKKVDLTATAAMLAERYPVLDQEETLFVLPESLQHFFAFIGQEVDLVNAETDEMGSALAAHLLRHTEADYDHSECDAAHTSFSERHEKNQERQAAIKMYRRIFWSIVNQMVNDADVEIREDFAVVKKDPEEESGLEGILGQILGGLGTGTVEVVGIGGSGYGSLDSVLGSLFGHRR